MEKPELIGRVSLLEVINSPLGFFALSLLIVEGFIVTFALAGQLEHTTQPIWLGSGLFVLVVSIVGLMVWFKPEHLIFTRENHLARMNTKINEAIQSNRLLQEALRDGMFFRSQKRYAESIGLYNRACIRCISNGAFSKADWLSDLRKAIQIRSSYRTYAVRDEDFRAYWSDPEFLAAIEGK